MNCDHGDHPQNCTCDRPSTAPFADGIRRLDLTTHEHGQRLRDLERRVLKLEGQNEALIEAMRGVLESRP